MILHFVVFLSIISEACNERVIMTLKYARQRLKPVIVNGQPVSEGKLPYMVSIKHPQLIVGAIVTYKNMCGGTIINERKVLTAAHCFELDDFYYAKHPSSLRVVAGDLRNVVVHSKDATTDERKQWRLIARLALHKDFNFPDNDLAVLAVEPAWSFSRGINKAVAARSYIDYPKTCYTAGYGRVGHGQNDHSSSILLLARTVVLTQSQCTKMWEVNMDKFICTASFASDVAQGDSGGPLTCRGTQDPAESQGKDLLVGVVSGKNFDKTTLYTRVAAYNDWIAEAEVATDVACKLNSGALLMFLVAVFINCFEI